MTLVLLIDLDDTLLDSNLEEFIPAYFQALSNHLADKVPESKLLPALIGGTKRMYENKDPERTLQEAFENYFYPALGLQKEDLAEKINAFYADVFPTLRGLTKPKSEAQNFIDWACRQGFRLILATDPVFPRAATHQRVTWAGLDPAIFEVISTFERFHFTKQNPSYYSELLGRIGWPDDPTIMAGNDGERDILPAQRMGISTYLLSSNGQYQSIDSPGTVFGDFVKFRKLITSTEHSTFKINFRSQQAQIANLCATPAVLAGLSSSLSGEEWSFKVNSEDWALTEIVCHLRDSELEINQMQIRMFDEQAEPFIPRPDAAVWARQRAYLSEEGNNALHEFSKARQETLSLLDQLVDDAWTRKARHSIFGPTDFLEVVGFMTEHDRLHIHQAWNALRGIKAQV